MNKRQKNVLIRFLAVIFITVAILIAMINFKDWVNRSEATKGMENLGNIVLDYRQKHGSVPPESYVDNIRRQLEGHVRLGDLRYRARWIDFGSTGDEILAYTEKNYSSQLLGNL